MTLCYIPDGARTQPDDCEFGPDEEDTMSYEEWIEEVEPGEVIDHPLVPLVYP